MPEMKMVLDVMENTARNVRELVTVMDQFIYRAARRSSLPQHQAYATSSSSSSSSDAGHTYGQSTNESVKMADAEIVAPEVVAGVMPDVAPEIVTEVMSDVIPEVVAEVMPDVAPEVIPDVAAEVISEVTPNVVPEIATEVMLDIAPEVVAEVMPDVAPEVIPDVAAEVISEVTPNVVPEIATEVMLDIAPEVVAEVMPDVAPEVVAEVMPDVAPEVVAEVMPDVAPEVVAEVMPDVAPEVVAEVMPDVAPEVVAEVMPDVAPEVVAEVTLEVVTKVLVPADREAPVTPRSSSPRERNTHHDTEQSCVRNLLQDVQSIADNSNSINQRVAVGNISPLSISTSSDDDESSSSLWSSGPIYTSGSDNENDDGEDEGTSISSWYKVKSTSCKEPGNPFTRKKDDEDPDDNDKTPSPIHQLLKNTMGSYISHNEEENQEYKHQAGSKQRAYDVPQCTLDQSSDIQTYVNDYIQCKIQVFIKDPEMPFNVDLGQLLNDTQSQHLPPAGPETLTNNTGFATNEVMHNQSNVHVIRSANYSQDTHSYDELESLQINTDAILMPAYIIDVGVSDYLAYTDGILMPDLSAWY